MIGWFRCYFAPDDIWFHYEVDDDGGVARQVDLVGADRRPVTAASFVELVRAQAAGDVSGYEARFGVLAEGVVGDPRGEPGVEEIGAEEFERTWTAARLVLERAA